MKLVYKGILKPNETLPLWSLPENAVRVKEPESFQVITLVSLLFIIPAIFLVAIITLFSCIFHGGYASVGFSWVGLILSSEIDERQKQLEIITVIKDSFTGKANVSANTILDVEHIMEKKSKIRNKKKLTMIYVGVGIAATLGLANRPPSDTFPVFCYCFIFLRDI